jgi:hypothetical protein
MDSSDAINLVYLVVGVLVGITVLLGVLIRRRNGGSKEAKELSEAASNISESGAKLVDSMSKYIILLQTQVEQTGSVPISPSGANFSYDTATLIDKHFTNEELVLLAASVNIDAEELVGDSRAARAMSLVVAARNRSKFWHLIENAKLQRPNVRWPNI